MNLQTFGVSNVYILARRWTAWRRLTKKDSWNPSNLEPAGMHASDVTAMGSGVQTWSSMHEAFSPLDWVTSFTDDLQLRETACDRYRLFLSKGVYSGYNTNV